MSLAATLDALEKVGASSDVILAVVRAHLAAEDERTGHPREDQVWVYVMGVDHPDEELVKVGISKHPNLRRITLEKERGLNLFVAHTEGPYTRAGAAEIERQAHLMLAAQRERGEWFLCGVERAAGIVRDCAIGAAS